MRILVVGAGATGGYFGGRLLQYAQHETAWTRVQTRIATVFVWI